MYISQFAQEKNDDICLEAIDIFLIFYGRFLATSAITFLSYGGLFIAGGILPKLAWRVPCLSSLLTSSSPSNSPSTDSIPKNDVLLMNYLDGGSKMGNTINRINLYLLHDNDIGVKGCLYKAISMI